MDWLTHIISLAYSAEELLPVLSITVRLVEWLTLLRIRQPFLAIVVVPKLGRGESMAPCKGEVLPLPVVVLAEARLKRSE